MEIPKAKYTVGDIVLVIRFGETLSDSYHYFGTVTKVEFRPDSAIASALKDGEVPIFYTLSNLSKICIEKLGDNQDHLWEHEINCAHPK